MSDYIDRNVGDIWFIFGESKCGCVDLSDGNNDILTCITREQAEAFIALRHDFLDKFRAMYEAAGIRGGVGPCKH